MSRIRTGVFGLAGAMLMMSPAVAQDQVGVIYRCDDGTDVTASFVTSANEVLITLDGRSFRLPQGMSGSGARYTDGTTVFWVKGDDAQLEAAGKSTTCHVR